MREYHDLLERVMKDGIDSADRTGVGTRSLFGERMRFDLTQGFPAITTKKLAWKAVVSELLWFIEGSGNERRLAEIQHGTREDVSTIWTANAQSPYWKPKAEYDGDLGRVYGVQWRDWRTPKFNKTFGYHTHDQLKSLIENLKNDPFSRRHILTAWNPGELDQMALPPCHMMAQFYVRDGQMSCQMYQRSADIFLGVPFNIASYALFTHMLAQVCGYRPKDLIIVLGDAHIYNNHFDAVKEQLSRQEFSLPTLWLDPSITDIEDFNMGSIRLDGYHSHDTIRAVMAV